MKERNHQPKLFQLLDGEEMWVERLGKVEIIPPRDLKRPDPVTIQTEPQLPPVEYFKKEDQEEEWIGTPAAGAASKYD